MWLTWTRLRHVCLQALAESLRVSFLHLVKHNSVILPHCSFFSSPRVDLLESTKSPICPLIKFMLWKLYQRQNWQSLQTGTTRWVSVYKRGDSRYCYVWVIDQVWGPEMAEYWSSRGPHTRKTTTTTKNRGHWTRHLNRTIASLVNLTNWHLFFMRLSCSWSWISA